MLQHVRPLGGGRRRLERRVLEALQARLQLGGLRLRTRRLVLLVLLLRLRDGRVALSQGHGHLLLRLLGLRQRLARLPARVLSEPLRPCGGSSAEPLRFARPLALHRCFRHSLLRPLALDLHLRKRRVPLLGQLPQDPLLLEDALPLRALGCVLGVSLPRRVVFTQVHPLERRGGLVAVEREIGALVVCLLGSDLLGGFWCGAMEARDAQRRVIADGELESPEPLHIPPAAPHERALLLEDRSTERNGLARGRVPCDQIHHFARGQEEFDAIVGSEELGLSNHACSHAPCRDVVECVVVTHCHPAPSFIDGVDGCCVDFGRAVPLDFVHGAVDALAERVIVLRHPADLRQEVDSTLLIGHVGNLLQQPGDGVLLIQRAGGVTLIGRDAAPHVGRAVALRLPDRIVHVAPVHSSVLVLVQLLSCCGTLLVAALAEIVARNPHYAVYIFGAPHLAVRQAQQRAERQKSQHASALRRAHSRESAHRERESAHTHRKAA